MTWYLSLVTWTASVRVLLFRGICQLRNIWPRDEVDASSPLLSLGCRRLPRISIEVLFRRAPKTIYGPGQCLNLRRVHLPASLCDLEEYQVPKSSFELRRCQLNGEKLPRKDCLRRVLHLQLPWKHLNIKRISWNWSDFHFGFYRSVAEWRYNIRWSDERIKKKSWEKDLSWSISCENECRLIGANPTEREISQREKT